MAELGPFELLQQLAGGYCVSRCLHAVAELGVADVLGSEPTDAGTLAEAVNANPDALARVMKLLATHGVFEVHKGRFAHNAASRLLRSDHPSSLRSLVRMFGLPINWDSYGVFEHAVRTGRPATELVHREGLWDWYALHPDAGQLFNEAMTAKARGQIDGVLAAYDFRRFNLIGDIGGGHGHLVRALLERAPTSKGILFDLPQVLATVEAGPRLMLQPGDFFHDALPSCDAYVLMEVIHDWGDDEALAILKALRRAAPPGAVLLLVEAMIAEAGSADFTRMLDIHMLALAGGRQRTRGEYEYLLRAAGFRLEREIATTGGVSILEAVAH